MSYTRTVTCQKCRREFKGGWRAKYCSTCRTITCANCGKKFLVRSYRINIAQYCSLKCAAEIVSPRTAQARNANIKRRYGRNHPNWKGGTFDKRGYKLISIKGKQVYEHRYLMEKHLGRKLETTEHVHHRNGNKSDNRIENLEVVDIREHTSKTFKGKQIVERVPLTCEWCGKKYFKLRRRDTRRFCSNACKNKWLSHHNSFKSS